MRPSRGLDLIAPSSLKAFGVGMHGILECLDRFPGVKQKDLTVVCYGCGDGRHIPFLVSFFPDVRWQIYAPEKKPLQIKHSLQTSLNIHRGCGTLNDCFDDIRRRNAAGDKILMFIDLDFHLRPEKIAEFNSLGIKPTVFSENQHFQMYTLAYKNACATADRNADILMVSMPLRMPWVTSDFEKNKKHAAWLSQDLDENVVLYPNVEIFPQFGSRHKSSEQRCLYTTRNAQPDAHIDWKKLDHETENADLDAKALEKVDFMIGLMDRCDAYLGQEENAHENEYLHAWSRIFVSDSKNQLIAQKDKMQSRGI